MNNEVAHQLIRRRFDDAGCNYTVFDHAPTRTSEDSARVRAQAGFPNAVGAKALLVKAEFRDGNYACVTLVLPSSFRLDSRTVRRSVPELRKFSFLTEEEMAATVGLSPGCMPPFGPTIFGNVAALYVDNRLGECMEIGFNVARMETSLVVGYADYLRVASPTAVVALTDGAVVQPIRGARGPDALGRA